MTHLADFTVGVVCQRIAMFECPNKSKTDHFDPEPLQPKLASGLRLAATGSSQH